jgi:uncharacterized MAPEG superfamily protein
MTIELQMLALSIVLGLVQIFVVASYSSTQRGLEWNTGPRDQPKAPLTGMGGRLDRALQNFLETFPLFAAAVLIAHVANRHSALTIWGAQLYFWGRLIYVPLYAFGVSFVRTAVWAIATLGIALILLALL